MHSDSKKRCSFLALLFIAGDVSVPGRMFGSSALRASETKRSTGKFPRITIDLAAVIL